MDATWDQYAPNEVDDSDGELDAEVVEALMRRNMAAHAAILDRGFITARQRETLRDEWDALYEDWLTLTGRTTYDG